jgi:lysophospholipase L1-like esterase
MAGWVARRTIPGFRRVAAQVAPYARAWEAANEAALAAGGRLWVALGDSTAQGIGAHAFDAGYVGQLRDRLGDGWRVVNLSRSGARTADLLAALLPRLDALPAPDLVTCGIGANDLVPTTLDELLAAMRSLIARLPPGSVLATLPQGLRPPRAVVVNDLIRTEAPAAGLRVADVWACTGPPWRGKFAADGFHPNAVGYRDWARAFAAAIGLPHDDATDRSGSRGP